MEYELVYAEYEPAVLTTRARFVVQQDCSTNINFGRPDHDAINLVIDGEA
jgi:hypothetical protein